MKEKGGIQLLLCLFLVLLLVRNTKALGEDVLQVWLIPVWIVLNLSFFDEDLLPWGMTLFLSTAIVMQVGSGRMKITTIFLFETSWIRWWQNWIPIPTCDSIGRKPSGDAKYLDDRDWPEDIGWIYGGKREMRVRGKHWGESWKELSSISLVEDGSWTMNPLPSGTMS